MKYEVTQPFKGSPDGHSVIAFNKGDEIEHDKLGDDLAEVALGEKWIKPVKQGKKEKAAEEAAAKAAAIASVEGEIATLETELKAATAAGASLEPIETDLATKRQELAALQV